MVLALTVSAVVFATVLVVAAGAYLLNKMNQS
jgi:hypothetical protein